MSAVQPFVRRRRRQLTPASLVLGTVLVALFGLANPARAQPLPLHVIVPIVECVAGDRNSYVAHFGYLSRWIETATLPITPEDNIFFGGNSNPSVGQPTEFAQGRHHDVFSAPFDPAESPQFFWALNGSILQFGLQSPHCAYPGLPRVAVFAACASPDATAGGATVRFGYLNTASSVLSYAVPHTYNRMGDAPLTEAATDRGQPATFAPGLLADAFTVQFDPAREAAVQWTLEGETAFAVPGLPSLPACVPGTRMTVSGSNQMALPGTAFPQDLVLRLSTASNDPLPGRIVTLSVEGGAASLSSQTATTDGNGEIRIAAVAGATPRAVRIFAIAREERISATFYLDIVATLPPPDTLFANSFE